MISISAKKKAEGENDASAKHLKFMFEKFCAPISKRYMKASLISVFCYTFSNGFYTFWIWIEKK